MGRGEIEEFPGEGGELAPSSRTKSRILFFNSVNLACTSHMPLKSDHVGSELIPKNTMSRKDDLTGEGPVTGNSVSDSNQKTNRRFKRNLHEKRFYIPSQDRHVTLKVSSKTLKTINKKGIQAVLQEARKQGYDV
jgi:large subunit ribosomal protein L28